MRQPDSRCCGSTQQSGSTEGKGLRVTPAASARMALTVCFSHTLVLFGLVTAVTPHTQQLNSLLRFFSLQSFFEGQSAPWDSAKKDENRMKNRYGNIIACAYKNSLWVPVCVSIPQTDYWLWITLSCSNTVLLSANKSSFDLCGLTFLFIFLLCLSSCVKKSPVFTWLLPSATFSFFFKKMQFYFLIKWCIICFIGQPYYSCWKTYI